MRLYQHRLFGLMLRMIGNRQEAKDIAQDVFVAVRRSHLIIAALARVTESGIQHELAEPDPRTARSTSPARGGTLTPRLHRARVALKGPLIGRHPDRGRQVGPGPKTRNSAHAAPV